VLDGLHVRFVDLEDLEDFFALKKTQKILEQIKIRVQYRGGVPGKHGEAAMGEARGNVHKDANGVLLEGLCRGHFEDDLEKEHDGVDNGLAVGAVAVRVAAVNNNVQEPAHERVVRDDALAQCRIRVQEVGEEVRDDRDFGWHRSQIKTLLGDKVDEVVAESWADLCGTQ